MKTGRDDLTVAVAAAEGEKNANAAGTMIPPLAGSGPSDLMPSLHQKSSATKKKAAGTLSGFPAAFLSLKRLVLKEGLTEQEKMNTIYVTGGGIVL